MKPVSIAWAEPSDAAEILRIFDARGLLLPKDAQWPKDRAYVVARVDGRIEAFCVVGMTEIGMLVSELWCNPTPVGRSALWHVVLWYEDRAQAVADETHTPVRCGGMVKADNRKQLSAAFRRGYAVCPEWDFADAVVIAKTFYPRPQEIAV
jgi:hypothetical protein